MYRKAINILRKFVHQVGSIHNVSKEFSSFIIRTEIGSSNFNRNRLKIATGLHRPHLRRQQASA
jgi:hypothetical protein